MKATFYGGSVTMIILIMASISGPALLFTQTAIASIEGQGGGTTTNDTETTTTTGTARSNGN